MSTLSEIRDMLGSGQITNALRALDAAIAADTTTAAPAPAPAAAPAQTPTLEGALANFAQALVGHLGHPPGLVSVLEDLLGALTGA